jgi:RNA polymerase sigma factor (sigma-70 family)
MQDKADEFIPTRASLLSRLKNWDDQQSWQEFFNIYRRLIFSAAIKAGLTEQEAEDVLQETVLSVARTIKQFKYDRSKCTFKTWLRHLTQRRIADQFRKRARHPAAGRAQTADSRQTSLLERVPDPESLNLDSLWEQEWKEKLLEAAIERVKGQVSPDQYQMFDFYVLRKMPVKQVATTLEVSAGKIYLAKHRISRLVRKEVKFLEKRMG